MTKKRIKQGIYIVTSSVLVVMIMGFLGKSDKLAIDQQNGLKYEGTYGLYVEKTDLYSFHWITEIEDIGEYQVLDQSNKIIVSGETNSSRTHVVKLKDDITEPFTLKFGGQKTSMNKVSIRKISEQEKTSIKRVDSLYVVGDVHGRYDQMTNLLLKANIIDADLNWTAGKSHIVFLGDVFDRGDDVTKVLWFIYELEAKAALVGGKVHLVLGNHEIMTMTKDLRYVSRKERNIAVAHGLTYDALFHPTNSYLGTWLRSKVSLLKIGKIVFAHGGILDLGPISLEEFNNKAYYYMKDPMYLDVMKQSPDSTKYDVNSWSEMRFFFYNSEGPYWYRGYVNSDTLAPQLNAMLSKHESKIHVVAHTTLETITEKYDGKLLTTDLNDAATELLFLIRRKNKYKRYKIDSEGIKTEL
ncbi:metallophosphoesterase [Lutimonas halocynthiae]|uniref:metallophosphoesterase n=1 Tax=Lutimonas halocynthiae TaxID=1446477 RepID=UPI0025B2FBCB|nr:metallophosphoesterase [Lutimonas halocynthiae]MDN3644316.1 metallophosphoesterase [Lutimonas halocynthiae]